MSLAVFTDSTTAQASPALNIFPTGGNSTKTTSVSSCWAWSVMPMVAMSPLTRTHSWVLAYLRSAGMFDMAGFKSCAGRGSICFSVNRFGHNDGGTLAAANFNLQRVADGGVVGRDVAHANAGGECGALSAAGDLADLARAITAPDGIAGAGGR